MRDLRRERACARKELAGFVELGPCLGLGFGASLPTLGVASGPRLPIPTLPRY
jgi:hypothetical protein